MGTAHDDSTIPTAGNWPVDPQEDVPPSKDRIWIDGCFDFAHHGHAGAMLQARRLGMELYCGVHSDEAILHNKGPPVMTLKERVSAVNACRWSTYSIPFAPYVTSLPWISHYGCQYVVHGDDVTSDSSGEDCYRYVKAAGRFLVVKRTPGISTTDLVGRMLLCTKSHFINSLPEVLAGEEGSGTVDERKRRGQDMTRLMKDFATDESGTRPGPKVFTWDGSSEAKEMDSVIDAGAFRVMVDGVDPQPSQHIVYVDGGFDLFSSGHIEFLKQVVEAEERLCHATSLQNDSDAENRSAYIVVGVHDDSVVNHWKGVNYPIMNIFERGLCVLQCRYVNSVVFSAPFTPSNAYLATLPFGTPHAVYHGPTSSTRKTYDPYVDAKALGIYRAIGDHEFQHVNAEDIVKRIMESRELYEERQRKKEEKSVLEAVAKEREALEPNS